MTIEELLEYPVESIAQMTDAELVAHLSPYFPITRPGKIPAAGSDTSEENYAPEIRAALAAARAAKPKPIDLSALRKKL